MGVRFVEREQTYSVWTNLNFLQFQKQFVNDAYFVIYSVR